MTIIPRRLWQIAGTLGIRTLNSSSTATTVSFDNLRADRLSGA